MIDPTAGDDSKKVSNQPRYVDGNLTFYFTSGENHQSYLAMPTNHPGIRLPLPASNDDVQGR